MYHSLILSFSLFPILGLTVPTATYPRRDETSPPGKVLSSTFKNTTYTPNNMSNSTKQFETINYFPNPKVKCSGETLDSDSNWKSYLDTAVTASSTSGIYGTCDVDGTEVDGEGVLGWKSGTVQVYYCNHGFTPNPCSVNEYWRADDLINDKCGENYGGWVTISDWGKTIGRDSTKSDGSMRSECGASLHGVSGNIVVSS